MNHFKENRILKPLAGQSWFQDIQPVITVLARTVPKVQQPFNVLCLLMLSVGVTSPLAQGQVISDGILSTSVTSPDNLNFTIETGSRAGNNLFHSFSEFSVPTNGSAVFNNANDIENIFSRVTGNNVSDIDGLIQANGTSNLFLLNPNGILFGPNASLDIGGSFVGSTADHIVFDDGSRFSATQANSSPLLTISAPVGLQMGANPRAIQISAPAGNNPDGLTIQPTQTLALVGGDINVEGGRITANGGRVELGSVGANSQVTLDSHREGWTLDYSEVETFQDIQLTRAAQVTSHGSGGGDIQVRGRNITLLETSRIESNTLGADDGGTLAVRATDTVEIVSIPTDIGNETGLFTTVDAQATGGGSDIHVTAGQLISVRNAAGIQTVSEGAGDGGDLFLNAPDVFIREFAEETFFLNIVRALTNATGHAGDVTVNARHLLVETSILSSTTRGDGNAGDLTVNAERVQILNGGQIQSFAQPFTAEESGNAGTVTIRSSDSVEIVGVTPFVINPENGLPQLSGDGRPASSALLVSTEALSRGDGGNILIETERLQVAQGGTIASSTLTSGQAGDIEIQATEIEVSGAVIDFSGVISGILSSAEASDVVNTGNGGSITITSERLRVLNGGQITASTFANGNAGSVTLVVDNIEVEGISSPLDDGRQVPSRIAALSETDVVAGTIEIDAETVRIRDGAEINVSSQGVGDSGNLTITARTIGLENEGRLQAEANGGRQGNIDLSISDLLVLRHGSTITTNAKGTSTGGNININVPFIVAIPNENSDIVANAVQGDGGNIQVTATGLLGIQFRPDVTPLSDITASSQFGVDGIVQIDTPNLNPDQGTAELPSDLSDPSNQIYTGCLVAADNSLTLSGRGGLPDSPDLPNASVAWEDWRPLETETSAVPISAPVETISLVEATDVMIAANGRVEFIAPSETGMNPNQMSCGSRENAWGRKNATFR